MARYAVTKTVTYTQYVEASTAREAAEIALELGEIDAAIDGSRGFRVEKLGCCIAGEIGCCRVHDDGLVPLDSDRKGTVSYIPFATF